MIKLENEQLVALLKKRDTMVKDARAISKKIEAKEKAIETQNKAEQKITASVEPADLITQGNILRDEINERIDALQKIADQIEEQKIAAIPEKMRDKHDKLRADKITMLEERAEIGEQLNEIKAEISPIVQELMADQLEDHEDIETVKLAGNYVHVTKFSYFDRTMDTVKKLRKRQEEHNKAEQAETQS